MRLCPSELTRVAVRHSIRDASLAISQLRPIAKCRFLLATTCHGNVIDRVPHLS